MRLTSIFVALFSLLALPAVGQTPIKKFQSVTAIHALNDKLLLCAGDGISGDELWVSDGTADGTKLLKDIRTGYPGSSIQGIFNYKDKAYFSAYTDEFQSELWVTDATAEGTKIFADLTPSDDYYGGTNPAAFTVFKEMLYFTSSGGKLYRTNGNPGSIDVIDQVAYSRIGFLNVVGDRLYYYKGSDILHWTDGTTKGDIDLPLDLEDTYFNGLFSTGETLYAMRASTYDQHIKLYVLSNTTFTWTKIFDLKAPVYGDQEIDQFTVVGDKLFFNIRKDYDNVPNTDELWVATETATEMLKSFNWDRYSAGSSMQNLFAFGNQLYFRAGFSAGRALWKSDGTVSGTAKVHDVAMAVPYNTVNPPVASGEKFYFAGSTSEYDAGVALWSSDGTTAGTKIELNLAGNGGGTPYLLEAKQGEVYFATSVEQFSVMVWSTAAAGDINIASNAGGAPLPYPATISFNMDNESCKNQQIEIRNDGSKALAMGPARVNGADFTISGDIPAILPPGAKFNLDILYYPASTDMPSGTLTIESSDENESPYTISLNPYGPPSATSVPGFCSTFSDKFQKVISPTHAQQAIRLTNYTVRELQPVGSAVGSLSLASGNALSYTLIAGEGDNDNALFTIDDATLKTNRVFVYYKKNNYLVRIQASLTDGQSVVGTFMIEIENTINTVSFDACEKRTERLDYQFMSITKNSVGHLFVVTNSGLIQQSTDGGATWKITDLNYPAFLSRIFFVGKKGFALGNVLLKSEDDGATWFQVYVPGSLSYGSSVYFIDENKGYLSVSNGGVYFTNDGGQTWTQRRQSSSFSDVLINLQFVDDLKGFGSQSSDLMQTLDGGRTWRTVDLSSVGNFLGYILSIRFINKDEGFVLTNSTLLQTADGGKQWTKTTLPLSGEMRAMKFTDAQTVYVFGPGLMLKSTDKGKTWSSITPQYGIADLVESNGTLYTIHGSLDNYGTGRALSKSVDNGSTWQTLQKIDDGYHRAIDFPTDNFGFIISESGNYRTTDGGVSWQPTTWMQKLNSAYFFDSNNGILSDSENMYTTDDGGQTITRVFTIEPVENQYRVFGTTYAISDDLLLNYGWGTLARSTNKGMTWEFIDIQGLNVQDIQFVSPSIGYIVGLFGDVYQTENGGETWVQKFESDPNDFDVASTIFFLADGIGFRGGETFSKSVDSGATWTDIFTPFRQKIRKLWFDSEDHGFAVCEGASFYETSDGGQTWTEHYIFNGDTPSHVRFRNGNIYFVGQEGYIAQYKNKAPTPLKPGYISGKTTACVGDMQTYYLPENHGYVYQWVAEGVNVIEQPSSLQAYFPKEGKYTFTVTAVNACGNSESRSLPITVVAGQKPIIGGEKLVPTGQKETYQIENSKSTATYSWLLTPAAPFEANAQEDNISLTWPTTPGPYTIQSIATDAESGCRTLSDGFNVEVSFLLGIDEPSDALSMYPNPASRVMVVASETTLLYSAKIYSLNGTLLMETPLKPGMSNTIHIDDLSPGVYVMKIHGEDDKVFRRKFVKQ